MGTDHEGVMVQEGDPVVGGVQVAQLEARHQLVVVAQLLHLVALHLQSEID